MTESGPLLEPSTPETARAATSLTPTAVFTISDVHAPGRASPL